VTPEDPYSDAGQVLTIQRIQFIKSMDPEKRVAVVGSSRERAQPFIDAGCEFIDLQEFCLAAPLDPLFIVTEDFEV